VLLARIGITESIVLLIVIAVLLRPIVRRALSR
jgi:hypothetical protein